MASLTSLAPTALRTLGRPERNGVADCTERYGKRRDFATPGWVCCTVFGVLLEESETAVKTKRAFIAFAAPRLRQHRAKVASETEPFGISKDVAPA